MEVFLNPNVHTTLSKAHASQLYDTRTLRLWYEHDILSETCVIFFIDFDVNFRDFSSISTSKKITCVLIGVK